MKFSLVLATIGRTKEIEDFCSSLASQAYNDIELIIVDQNVDDRLVPIIQPYSSKFTILHLRCEKGLSKARNHGLKFITGDIVCFPDDDCVYPVGLLNKVHHLFQNKPDWDGVTGCSVDLEGKVSAGDFSDQESFLTPFNLWNRNISFTIFLKEKVIKDVGGFDEKLGLGAPSIFQSGEETDYLIRALNLNYKIFYVPDLLVYHPNPILVFNSKAFSRAYSYGCGWGRVVSKHRYPIWFKLYTLIRPLGGSVLSFLTLRMKKSYYHLNIFRGRLKGILSQPV